MRKNKFFLNLLFLANISFCFPEEYLKLISFNIHGFNQKKILNKVNEIIDNIDDLDIILIQENWSYKTLFLEKLKNFTIFFGNRKKATFLDTGLTNSFSSKIDVIEYEDGLFSDCSGYIFRGSDCLSSKGFIYAKINYNGKILDVYNTHLDSGDSRKDKCARKKQLEEFKNFIISKKSNIPYIICGDFNIDYFSEEKAVIDKFILDLNLKIINSNSKYTSNKKIDYILFNGINDFMYLDLSDTLYHLSDHYPESIMLQVK